MHTALSPSRKSLRLNEMIAGARSDVAIKICGDDLMTLRRLSDEVQAVLGAIPGRGEFSGELRVGQLILQVKVDSNAVARYACQPATC